MRTGPFTLMWVMIIDAMLFVGPPALIVGASVLFSTRRARRGDRDAVMRNARAGRIGGLIVGALVGAMAFLAGFRMLAPELVAVGYLVGLLITELRPSGQPTGPIRVASLQARDSWRYLPRWVVPVAVGSGVLAVVAPVLFAVFPPPEPYLGLGWLIALTAPLTVIAVLALVGWVALMARVTTLPQSADQAPDGDSVTRERTNTARAIAGAVLGIELLVLGALALVASGYLRSGILIWTGLGLALTGILIWSIMSRWRIGPAEPADHADPGPATPSVA